MTGPVSLDSEGRMWEWLGHTVDVGIDGGAISEVQDYEGLRLVGNAILAHRDATGTDLQQFAEELVRIVEEHPPWDGNCRNCGTSEPCSAQLIGDELALVYAIRKSTDLVRRSRANVAAFDARMRLRALDYPQGA